MKRRFGFYLTFFIPFHKVRIQLKEYIDSKISKFFFQRKYEKELNKLIAKHNLIFSIVHWKWNDNLHQRAQHLATQFSKIGVTFLYSDYFCNFALFQSHSDNLFFLNKEAFFCVKSELAKKVYMIVTSTVDYFTLEKCLELKQIGYHIIYDCVDDFDESILGKNEEQLRLYNNLEKVDPDLILATSTHLYKQLSNRFPKNKILLNRNAVDIKDFLYSASDELIPDDFAPILNEKKPIIGYYGAMAPWLDWKLINRIAYERKNYNFVYIGPDYGKALKNLKKQSNVYYLGVKKYENLAHYAKHFTCCTIPFSLGDIAKSTSPLKLYEYMALKKPVVCTRDLKECYGYEGILIASDAADFLLKLDEAVSISNNDEIKAKLFHTALDNTWEKRAMDILKLINKQHEEGNNV